VTGTILTLAVAYGLLAVVASLVALHSRLSLVLRIGLVASVVVLIFTTYRGIGDLRGLPSDTDPPDRFRLYWAQIEEPNKLTKDPGSIFLWIGELDEDFFVVGMPRAHKLPYTEELAVLVADAQKKIAAGEQIAGEIQEDAQGEGTAEELALEAQQGDEGTSGSRVGQRFLQFDFGSLRFETAPAPTTPDKSN